jgi:hypothetical protein
MSFMKLGQMKLGQMKLGRNKLGRTLAIGLFAVIGLMSGAWAQTDDYPKEPPNAQPPSMQGPGGQPGPVMQQGPGAQNGPNGQQYPGGPNGPGYGGSGGNGPGPNGEGPNGEQQKSDGPAPAVARLSLIYGDVSTQRGDSGDWAVSTVNAPVMLGDQVATGEKSRTEIQLDFADLLRLAARSQVKIADLTAKRIQVQVAQGYTSYSVMKGGEADVEIDSPNAAVHPLKVGRYRVQVNSDAETDVIVREGEAEITTPQGSVRVREGDMITIRGTDNPEYKVSKAPEKDDWDKWNRDRDSVISEADGPRRTNRYYTGAADLDGYGNWVYVPGYGNVWQPYQQQANWAPYQSGRWVWEGYYGWTWVSYESWGWAPYHYGRWFYYQNAWCWWPGPVYSGYRPLWSPAFVTFIGFGPRVGFGFGSIGWFPVGPHDVFYPWYGRGFNRVNVVAFGSVGVVGRGGFIAPLAVRGRQPFFSNANLVLTNPRVRASVTSVSTTEFGRGGNVGLRRGVEENELRDSHVMTGNVPVVPTRESLNAGRTNTAGPAGVQTRTSNRFFTQHQPPAGPESFHDQAARVQRVVSPETASAQGSRGQESINHQESGNANNRGNAEVPRTGGTSGNGAATNGTSARQGTSQPSGGESKQTGNSGADANRSGWSHFGPPGGRTNTQTGSAESGARTNDSQAGHGESGGSKPPLELHRPIVTERQSDTRNSQGSTSSAPRTTDSRSSTGSGQPRYTPPPRSDSRSSGSSSRSSSSQSRSSSSSRSSSHSDSKSSSSGKH